MRRWRNGAALAAALLYPSTALAHNPGAAALSLWVCVAASAAVGIPVKRWVATHGRRAAVGRLVALAVLETFLGIALIVIAFTYGWAAATVAGLAALGIMAGLHVVLLRGNAGSRSAVLVMTLAVPAIATIVTFLLATPLYFVLE